MKNSRAVFANKNLQHQLGNQINIFVRKVFPLLNFSFNKIKQITGLLSKQKICLNVIRSSEYFYLYSIICLGINLKIEFKFQKNKPIPLACLIYELSRL